MVTHRLSLSAKPKNIEFPCIVTGLEDFPWEEKYVFGHGNKKEYEKLKKDNPLQ
ncbi:MAG: hypothetical protein WBR24_26015 [Desulfobacterales bacterium]|jgi:hypothetical protein